jgi:hypothetical protein
MSTGSYRYFMRGRAAEAPAGAHLAGSSGSGRKVKLKEWDVYLKKFQCVPSTLLAPFAARRRRRRRRRRRCHCCGGLNRLNVMVWWHAACAPGTETRSTLWWRAARR